MTRTASTSALLPTLFAAAAIAQGPPRTLGPDGRSPGGPLPPATATAAGVSVTRTSVTVAIDDAVATTRIEQTLHNDGARDAEVTWLLPVPAGAIADSLEMRVGDKVLAAEVLDARTARGVYEEIVRKRRDPALLEYAGEGLLRARVFPVPPRGDVAVTVRLRQVIAMNGGLGEWRLPLRALRLSEQNTGPIGVDVTVRAQTALKTVFASRTDAEVRWKSETEARVAFEIGGAQDVERELQIVFGLAASEFGLHALTYRKPGDDGWYLMFVSPRRELAQDLVPPRCVQFVIDTSGSMKGEKLEQAKKALRTFLGTLRAKDRFQIVPFSTEARPFFPAPRAADSQALRDAALRIDELQAQGGTNIADALAAALDGVPDPDKGSEELSLIVFVTDGNPTIGLGDPRRLLADVAKRNTRATRLFTFGVGDDVNRALLADLAADNHATADFVEDGPALERRTSALCTRIAQPALTDVQIACTGLERFESSPRTLPDLFAGDTLQVVGRYRGTGRREVVLRGTLAGVAKEYRFDVDFPAEDKRRDFVPVTWAQREIDVLLAQIRRGGPAAELVAEVTRLAREFGVTTPYTSQLIVEDGVRLAGPADQVPPTPGGGRGTGGPTGPRGPTTGGRGVEIGSTGFPSTPAPGAPTTGSDAFHLGATRRAGTTAQPAPAPSTRRASGRGFVRIDKAWVENGLPDDWAKTAREVTAFSDAYFELLRQHPDLGEALALGTDVVVRVGEEIVHVVPATTTAPASGTGNG